MKIIKYRAGCGNAEYDKELESLLNAAEAEFVSIENRTIGDGDIRREFAEVTLDTGALYFLAVGDDGMLIGCAALYGAIDSEPVVFLNHLYVKEKCRRKGVATALVEQAMLWCAKHHAAMRFGLLSGNKAGKAFWRWTRGARREIIREYYMNVDWLEWLSNGVEEGEND